MKTIYGKITPSHSWVNAEICYKQSEIGGGEYEVALARKCFGDSFYRSLIKFSSEPSRKNYEDATKWVHEYLSDADEFGSYEVIFYEPQQIIK